MRRFPLLLWVLVGCGDSTMDGPDQTIEIINGGPVLCPDGQVCPLAQGARCSDNTFCNQKDHVAITMPDGIACGTHGENACSAMFAFGSTVHLEVTGRSSPGCAGFITCGVQPPVTAPTPCKFDLVMDTSYTVTLGCFGP